MKKEKKLTPEEEAGAKAAAEEMLKEKKYSIAGKTFVNKISLEQYESFDDILAEAGVTEEDLNIDFKAKDVVIAQGLLKIYDKLTKKKLLRKLLSYYLVEEGAEFDVQSAKANENLFKKLSNQEAMLVFRDFFIGNYLSLLSASEE